MEAKKMVLKDSKGKEKDEDYPPFQCLVDAAVAVAAREEELKVEERLMKETIRLKEILKKIDNAVNNALDFSKKTFVINDKNLSLMLQNPVNEKPFAFSGGDKEPKTLTGDGLMSKNCTSLRIFGTDIISIGESKADEEVSCINQPEPYRDSLKKQSFKAKNQKERVDLKCCFESGETSRAKKPKLKEKTLNYKGTFAHQLSLSERLKEMIKGMEGTEEKLIIQKTLYNTDLSEHHGRISIPMNQVKAEFLTDEEKNMLKQGSRESIEALVSEPCLKTRDMSFKRWDMKKPTGKPCSLYILISGWQSMVEDNGFKVHDEIQVWSFRVNSKLCFALVRVKEGRRSQNSTRNCSKFKAIVIILNANIF